MRKNPLPEQALYLKWRPLSFDDVIGQEHITRTLRNSLKTGRIRHAYLFSGPRGTGKTTNARLLAKAVNCTHPDAGKRPCNECPQCVAINEGRYMDLIEIDAATHTGVDDVRDLRDKIAFSPGEGRYKVYIIDEVHRFTGNAFDALLKTLEEPPDHAIFVLATTEIDKVPDTIKSRCLQFEFRRVSLHEVADHLGIIASNEGLNIERGALEIIARQGTGSVRDSISLLDQIVSDPEEVITVATVQRILGTADDGAVRDVVEALIAEDVTGGLHVINTAVDSGSDPRHFGQQIVENLRAIMLAQTASADLIEAAEDDRQRYQKQAGRIDRARLLRAIRLFNDAVNDLRSGWQPQLSLELALIEAVRTAPPVVAQPAQQVATPAQAAPASGGGVPVESAPPDVEPLPVGSAPVVEVESLRQRWNEVLSALYQIHTGAPAVLQYYRVHHVDGHTVYLCTDNALYFQRLDGQEQKLNIIEKALWRVYQKSLRVQVMMVQDINRVGASAVSDTRDIPDAVLRSGVEQLGGQYHADDKYHADDADN
ncbi:MAG: DNA polymerase III subunit gamma/tau [Anaerolineaceae bacterium]|nr:MAG: DNA polymerase III subunit gamma/tau [Anaerolineaceae bacterium]